MNCWRILLVTFALLATGLTWAEVAPTVSIRDLVDASDLIVVGKVIRVQQTDTGQVAFHEQLYTRRDFRAEIRVAETIKGDPAPSNFVLSFSTPSMDRVGNVAEEGLVALAYEQVIFFKKIATGYSFASPYTPSLEGSSTSCGPEWSLGNDAYHKVMQRVLDVFCTPSTPEEKRSAVHVLNWSADSSAAPFLKAALSLPNVIADPDVRTSIVGDLLKWGDLTGLPVAEADLFQSSQNTSGLLQSNLLLAISSLEPNIAIPLLTRALTLPDPEARVGAARFLEYTKSDAALDPLLSALDDPDREVQFAVMQSLGNLTNQHYWRPQTTQTDAKWLDCIQHWRQFGDQRKAKASSAN